MAGHRWHVAQAKAELSAMLRQAQRGPQVIESRGKEVAVVIGIEAWRRLSASEAAQAPASRLAGFLRASAELRQQGGATLKLAKRQPRRSPFAAKH